MADKRGNSDCRTKAARTPMRASNSPDESAEGYLQAEAAAQSDLLRVAELVNRKQDEADGDYRPKKRIRHEADEKLSLTPQRREQNDSNSNTATKIHSRSVIPFDTCSRSTQAKRMEHIDNIERIWGRDATKWPTYSRWPARASRASNPAIHGPEPVHPRDLTIPFLKGIADIARAAKDVMTHAGLQSEIEQAVRERVQSGGGREVLGRADIDSVRTLLLSKEKIVAPTLAPLDSLKLPTTPQQDRADAGPDASRHWNPTEVARKSSSPATIKQEANRPKAPFDISRMSPERRKAYFEACARLASLEQQMIEATDNINCMVARECEGVSIAQPITMES